MLPKTFKLEALYSNISDATGFFLFFFVEVQNICNSKINDDFNLYD